MSKVQCLRFGVNSELITKQMLRQKLFKDNKPMNFEQEILRAQKQLNTKLSETNFVQGNISYVYNPLEYALDPYMNYIRTYCKTKKKVLIVGMNPGPFGMCQTGIPFGDVQKVRSWLGIEGNVLRPELECPARPIRGFQSTRSEQSGARFWTLFEELCTTPDRFFAHCLVYNYCPVALMKANGTNVTPASLKVQWRHPLEEACDECYVHLINLLQPELIIAVGEYVEKRTKLLVKKSGSDIRVLRLPHPSPIVPNNQDWNEKARAFFIEHKLVDYFELDG